MTLIIWGVRRGFVYREASSAKAVYSSLIVIVCGKYFILAFLLHSRLRYRILDRRPWFLNSVSSCIRSAVMSRETNVLFCHFDSRQTAVPAVVQCQLLRKRSHSGTRCRRVQTCCFMRQLVSRFSLVPWVVCFSCFSLPSFWLRTRACGWRLLVCSFYLPARISTSFSLFTVMFVVSQAPIKRLSSGSFDYDSSLTTVRSITRYESLNSIVCGRLSDEHVFRRRLSLLVLCACLVMRCLGVSATDKHSD